MLRNRSGWAWRLLVTFLLPLLFHCSSVRGGPLIGTPPGHTVTTTTSNSSSYTVPTTYSLSGEVYVDSAEQGKLLPGDWGISGVDLKLAEYTVSNGTIGSTPTAWFYATTNASGSYDFTGLTPGDDYTIVETQPSAFTNSKPVNGNSPNTIGYFLSATGGSLAAPTGVFGTPANGSQSSSYPDIMYFIALPSATGSFAPNSSGGVYSAVGYNFGEMPITPINTNPGGIGKPPVVTGVGAGGGSTTPSGSISLSLSIVGSNDRFLAGSGAGSLGLSGAVLNPANAGSSAIDWTIPTQSTGVSLAPTSGTNLGPQNQTSLTGSVNGTSLSPGTQNATVTVTGNVTGTSQSVGSATTTVVIDPVDSRTISSVSTATFGRIMQGSGVSSSFTVSSTGSHDQYSDLTMNVGTVSGSNSAGTFSGTNGNSVLFNGTTTTSQPLSVSATFSTAVDGPVSSTLSLPGNTGLFTAETLASGTPTLPSLSVPFTATVLQPRSLASATGGTTNPISVPAATGGLLYGAVVPVLSYSVSSTNANPDSNHTSMVYVGNSSAGQTVNAYSTSDGTTQVGQVIVSQTLVDGSTPTQTVPVSVGAYTLGPVSGSASINVVTAEATSVGDHTNYVPVPVAYTISNVGYASTGGPDSSNANNQLIGAPLSAPFLAGQQIAPAVGGPVVSAEQTYASLTSIVAAAGTSGSNSTATAPNSTVLSQQGTVNSSNYSGAVGSEADILASTALSSSANITMAWRARNNAENGVPSGVNGSGQTGSQVLPEGVAWLTSDVMELGGAPGDLDFAMQMSYDNRINTYIGGPSDTATVAGSYLGKYIGGVWTNAVDGDTTTGIHAQTAVANSLSDFLSTEFSDGYTLDQLVGSWGVDLANQESWAILNNGNGQYAVVPEPSTFALLAAAAGGLCFYRLRRRSRRATAA